jgi:hypothetical protein
MSILYVTHYIDFVVLSMLGAVKSGQTCTGVQDLIGIQLPRLCVGTCVRASPFSAFFRTRAYVTQAEERGVMFDFTLKLATACCQQQDASTKERLACKFSCPSTGTVSRQFYSECR